MMDTPGVTGVEVQAVDGVSAPSAALKLRGWARTLTPPTAQLLVGLDRGDLRMVREALQHADVDLTALHMDRNGSSALQLAAMHPDPDLVVLLVDNCYPPREKLALIPNAVGETAFHAAARFANNATSLPLLLMAYGPCPLLDHRRRSYMHDLMQNTAMPFSLLLQTTEHMLHAGDAVPLLNLRDDRWCTVLDVAVARGRPHEGALHMLLLSYGAKRGTEIDDTERNVTLSNEQRQRALIVQDEAAQWKAVMAACRSGRDVVDHFLRRRRQWERLGEKESLIRHEIEQWFQQERASIVFAQQSEMHEAQRMAHFLIESRAALQLQSRWRQRMAERVLCALRHDRTMEVTAAIALQRRWRKRHAAMQSAWEMRRHAAAVRVQRWYRGLRTRRFALSQLTDTILRRKRAALSILVAYRRYRTACRWEVMEQRRMGHVAMWCDEAFAALQHAVVRLQTWTRMRQASKRYQHDVAAVRFLQLRARDNRRSREDRRERIRRMATDRVRDALLKFQSIGFLRRQMRAMLDQAARSRVERTSAMISRWLSREVFLDLYRLALQRRNQWWQWWGSAAERHHRGSPAVHMPFGGVLEHLALWCGWMQWACAAATAATMIAAPRGLRQRDWSAAGWTASQLPQDARDTYTAWYVVDLSLSGFTLLFGVVDRLLSSSASRSIASASAWRVEWLLLEVAVCGAALVCTLFEGRESARIVNALVLVKLPMLLHRTSPKAFPHVAILCACMDLVGQWLVRLALPVVVAALVGCVRVLQFEPWMLSPSGRWSAVLLALTHPMAALSSRYVALRGGGGTNTSCSSPSWSGYPSTCRLFGATMRLDDEAALGSGDGWGRLAVPLVPLVVLWVSVWTSVFAAQLLGCNQGLHGAVRVSEDSVVHQVDSQEDVFTARERRRLRKPHLRRVEEGQLGAVEHDDELEAAKTALLAAQLDFHQVGQLYASALHSSHADDDDSTLLASLRPSQDVAIDVADEPDEACVVDDSRRALRMPPQSGRVPMPPQSQSPQVGGAVVAVKGVGVDSHDVACDLRLESRAWCIAHDQRLVAAVLRGAACRWKGAAEVFWFRQWNGPCWTREVHAVLIAMVVCSMVFPQLYWMEVGFSVALLWELVQSARVLGFGFVFMNRSGLGLLHRLFGVVVGLVPQSRPLTVLRLLRLLEGWGPLNHATALHWWCVAGGLYLSAVVWGVGLIAVRQLPDVWAQNGDGFVAQSAYNVSRFACTTTTDCIAEYTVAFLIPNVAFEGHVDPENLPATADAMIIIQRLLTGPLLIVLLLQMTNPAVSSSARFLRLLVSRIHRDTVTAWRHMTETEWWFSHRKLHVETSLMTDLPNRSGAIHEPPISSQQQQRAPDHLLRPASSVVSIVGSVEADGGSHHNRREAPRHHAEQPTAAHGRITVRIVARMLQWAARARQRCCRRHAVPLAHTMHRSPHEAAPLFLLQRSKVVSLAEALPQAIDDQHRSRSRIRVVVTAWKRSVHLLRRNTAVHLLHTFVTLLSVAFLWVHVDRQYSLQTTEDNHNSSTVANTTSTVAAGCVRIRGAPIPLRTYWFRSLPLLSTTDISLTIAEICVHGSSVLLGWMLVPWDSSSLLVVISTTSLVVAMVLQHTHTGWWSGAVVDAVVASSSSCASSGSTALNGVMSVAYPLRFISVLRLLTLHVGPFSSPVQQATARWMRFCLLPRMIPALVLVVGIVIVVVSVTARHSDIGDDGSLASVQLSGRNALESSLKSNGFADAAYQVLHYWLLPLWFVASAILLPSMQIPHRASEELIRCLLLLVDDPLLQASPLGWFWGIARWERWICTAANGAEKILTVVLVLWSVVGSACLPYSSAALNGDVDGSGSVVFPRAMLSAGAALVLCHAILLLRNGRRLLFYRALRVGSTVYGSRFFTSTAHLTGDPMMMAVWFQACWATGVRVVTTAYWVCIVVAAGSFEYQSGSHEVGCGLAINSSGSDSSGSGSLIGWMPVVERWFLPFQPILMLTCLPACVWRIALLPKWRASVAVVVIAGVLVVAVSASLLEWTAVSSIQSNDQRAYRHRLGDSLQLVLRTLLSSRLPSLVTNPAASESLYGITISVTSGAASLSSPVVSVQQNDLVLWVVIALKLVLAGIGGYLVGVWCTALRWCKPDGSDLAELPPQARALYDILAKQTLLVSMEATNNNSRSGNGAGNSFCERNDSLTSRMLWRSLDGSTRGLWGREQGIPRFALKSLLETCKVLHPAVERRRYHALLELLTCLPILDARATCRGAYVAACRGYDAGGPDVLPFQSVPSYRAEAAAPLLPMVGTGSSGSSGASAPRWMYRHGFRLDASGSNSAASRHGRSHHHASLSLVENVVSAGRLVQAVAYMEAVFPVCSTVDSIRWLDFMALQRYVRGAVALQSLWRMYRAMVQWERLGSPNDRGTKMTRMPRVLMERVRRSVRLQQAAHRAAVFTASDLQHAIRRVGPVYSGNPLVDSVAHSLRRGQLIFSDHSLANRTPSSPTRAVDDHVAGSGSVPVAVGGSMSPFASRSAEFHIHPDLARMRQSSQPWHLLQRRMVDHTNPSTNRYQNGVEGSSALSRADSGAEVPPPSSSSTSSTSESAASSSSARSTASASRGNGSPSPADATPRARNPIESRSPSRPSVPSTESHSSPSVNSVNTRRPAAVEDSCSPRSDGPRETPAPPRPPSEPRMPGAADDEQLSPVR